MEATMPQQAMLGTLIPISDDLLADLIAPNGFIAFLPWAQLTAEQAAGAVAVEFSQIMPDVAGGSENWLPKPFGELGRLQLGCFVKAFQRGAQRFRRPIRLRIVQQEVRAWLPDLRAIEQELQTRPLAEVEALLAEKTLAVQTFVAAAQADASGRDGLGSWAGAMLGHYESMIELLHFRVTLMHVIEARWQAQAFPPELRAAALRFVGEMLASQSATTQRLGEERALSRELQAVLPARPETCAPELFLAESRPDLLGRILAWSESYNVIDVVDFRLTESSLIQHAIARLARTAVAVPTPKPDAQPALTHELVVRALAQAPAALHLARLIVEQAVEKENEHVLQWVGERAARRTLLAAGRQLVALHKLAEPADVFEMSEAGLLGSLREAHL
jgi:hypothetical protein